MPNPENETNEANGALVPSENNAQSENVSKIDGGHGEQRTKHRTIIIRNVTFILAECG